MTHKLKSWPSCFGPIVMGNKTFELRRDDRGYNVGDVLLLQEWDQEKKAYTGREAEMRVTYILRSKDNNPIAAGYCIMAIRDIVPSL